MRKTCNWKGKYIESYEINGIKYPIIPLLEFLGWFIAEGCTSNRQISIFQSPTYNQKNFIDIQLCLGKLGLNVKPQKRLDEIRFYGKKWVEWLNENCGRGSRNKKVPEFIKELTPSLINVFLNTLFRGDGWKNKFGNFTGYKSVSKKLRDDVCELLLKTGSCGTVCDDTVSIQTEQLYPTVNTKPKRVYYKGYVYDVTVPNHLIFVRRNGRIIITGNSYPAQRRQRDTPPSQRPSLSAAGHRHVIFYTYYNDEHMFETGCFMRSSPYLLGRGIQSTIAGWMTELKIKDKKIKKIKPELLVF